MFTGIVQPATVHAFDPLDNGGARLELELAFVDDLELGESVAVNGCCLTVAQTTSTTAAFDLLQETLRVTNLGDLETGLVVNVERALRLGDRLSGHTAGVSLPNRALGSTSELPDGPRREAPRACPRAAIG